MSYFSRLTDIVTCSLSDILAKEDEPAVAITRIIGEMEEGLNGARRSVKTAAANADRIRSELDAHAERAAHWTAQAKSRLQARDENAARLLLLRKREVVDLMAGLELQHKAAVATHEHLTTTLHALEARLAEARRRQQQLASGDSAEADPLRNPNAPAVEAHDPRAEEIERDLEALRRELEES